MNFKPPSDGDPRYRIAISADPSEKMPHGDPRWAAFNQSFQNLEIETIELANYIFTGHAYTTWHKGGRKSDNFQCGHHIGIDLDTEDERSTIDYLLKDDFISRYAALIHTTPSHTPDAPRARVVFLLDTPIYQANNYIAATNALLWLFEIADGSCKDACRFFYGAKDCEIALLGNVLPLEFTRMLISEWQQAEAKKRQERVRQAQQKPQITIHAQHSDTHAELQRALKGLNPWSISYYDWVRVLMGIHHELGEAGLSIAEQWADGKEGEVRRKWRSFDTDGNTKGTVTVATLFDIAKEYGRRAA